jgi:hypothetical protein
VVVGSCFDGDTEEVANIPASSQFGLPRKTPLIIPPTGTWSELGISIIDPIPLLYSWVIRAMRQGTPNWVSLNFRHDERVRENGSAVFTVGIDGAKFFNVGIEECLLAMYIVRRTPLSSARLPEVMY